MGDTGKTDAKAAIAGAERTTTKAPTAAAPPKRRAKFTLARLTQQGLHDASARKEGSVLLYSGDIPAREAFSRMLAPEYHCLGTPDIERSAAWLKVRGKILAVFIDITPHLPMFLQSARKMLRHIFQHEERHVRQVHPWPRRHDSARRVSC